MRSIVVVLPLPTLPPDVTKPLLLVPVPPAMPVPVIVVALSAPPVATSTPLLLVLPSPPLQLVKVIVELVTAEEIRAPLPEFPPVQLEKVRSVDPTERAFVEMRTPSVSEVPEPPWPVTVIVATEIGIVGAAPEPMFTPRVVVPPLPPVPVKLKLVAVENVTPSNRIPVAPLPVAVVLPLPVKETAPLAVIVPELNQMPWLLAPVPELAAVMSMELVAEPPRLPPSK